jgi:hypothetical protein
MTTRRDLVKLASALGLTGALPPSTERLAAMHALAQPVSDRIALDPVAFATTVEATLPINGIDRFSLDWDGAIAPEAYAAYTRAAGTLHRVLVEHGIHPLDACDDFEAAHFNLTTTMYDAGLRHGAAFEHLRRSVIGDVAVCMACRGLGFTGTDDVCVTCGGTGTVALKA